MASQMRLRKEWSKYVRAKQRGEYAGIEAQPVSESDLTQWTAFVFGPHGSPYQGGKYNMTITFPQNYPFSPPTVMFRTRIYHPNIAYDTGSICLDILKPNKWSPCLSIGSVLLSIQSLLTDANPDDPLMADVAREYVNDPRKFVMTARAWTERYARP